MNIDKQLLSISGVARTAIHPDMYGFVRSLPLYTRSRTTRGAMRNCLSVHFDDAVVTLNVDFSTIAVHSLTTYLPDGTAYTVGYDTNSYGISLLSKGKTAPEFEKVVKLAAAVNSNNARHYVVNLAEANEMTGLDVKLINECPGLRIYSCVGHQSAANKFAQPVGVVTGGTPDELETLRTLRAAREHLHPDTYVETFDDVMTALGLRSATYVDAEYLEVTSNHARLIFMIDDGRPLLVFGAVEHGTTLSSIVAPYVFGVVQTVDRRRATLRELAGDEPTDMMPA